MEFLALDKATVILFREKMFIFEKKIKVCDK